MSGRSLMLLLLPGFLWVWLLPNSTRIRFIKGSSILMLLQLAATLYMLFLAIDQFGSYSPFLYFQF